MEILVIGGSGFLSSAVVSELREAGHGVTVFTRGQRPLPEGVRAIHGDRKDEEGFVRALEGRAFDAVVDCICYTPADARADLRAFSGRVRHLIMISTDFVYGPQRSLPMDEDTPARAMSQYGRDKAACEGILIGAWHEEGFPATVLRPPHIMGAGGLLGSGSLQGRDPMLLDRLAQRAPMILLDGGTLLVQPVVHRDIGKACAAVLGRENTLGQAYNVAGPDCVTTRQYYEIIAATLGIEDVEYLSLPSDCYVRAYPERAPFAHHRTYTMEKLARDTGYRPETTLRHAVYEMVDAIGCREVEGRTVWGEPYVPTDEDRRVIEACRRFEAEVLHALRHTPEG